MKLCPMNTWDLLGTIAGVTPAAASGCVTGGLALLGIAELVAIEKVPSTSWGGGSCSAWSSVL